MMRAILPALLLAGCATQPQIEVRTVQVPIPVPCQEPVPAEPVWPTQHLFEPTIAEWMRAAMSELERRQAYELQLVTALEICRRPIESQ